MDVHPTAGVAAQAGRLLEATFAPLAADKGLAFAVEVDPDVPQELLTDEQRLQQVLRNLLSNAVKFTPKGEVRCAWCRACRRRRLRRRDPARRPRPARLRGDRHRHRHRRRQAARSSSRRSGRPTAPPAASTAARAWACRSAGRSPGCSAARSTWTASWARAAPSPSTCPPSYSGPLAAARRRRATAPAALTASAPRGAPRRPTSRRMPLPDMSLPELVEAPVRGQPVAGRRPAQRGEDPHRRRRHPQRVRADQRAGAARLHGRLR